MYGLFDQTYFFSCECDDDVATTTKTTTHSSLKNIDCMAVVVITTVFIVDISRNKNREIIN